MDYIIKRFYSEKTDTTTFLKIICIVTFLVLTIDIIWITLVMGKQYSIMIGDIQNTSMLIRLLPTILSYFTIIIPIVLFVIPRISKETILLDSIIYGGIMGFLMYGMFSFTNYALIRNWTVKVVLLDIVWGSFLYSIVSYLTVLLIL